MEIESENEKTSYDKGRELEIEFSTYMKHELEWNKVRVGAHLPGKLNRKGAAIDAIGERLDSRGKSFYNAGIWVLATSVICALASALCIYTELGTGELFLTVSIVSIVGAIVYLLLSVKFNKENAWVECKNLKGKVNISHIDKSLREYKDYINSNDKEYKFQYHYFVSANGYVENALKYALEHNIICYEKSGDTFKKVGYWDN